MLVFLACIAGGCAAPNPDGPAVLGGGAGEICTPIREGKTMLIGDLFQASNASEVKLDSASLKDEKNVHVKHAWVLPVEDPGQSYISMGTLEDSPTAKETWSSKQPLKDYRMSTQQPVNVVFEVEIEDPGQEASTAGMSVNYSSGSTNYVTEGEMGYRFLTSTCLSTQQ